MRILIVSKSLPHTFKGGIQTHVWELSQRLMELGYEVTILTGGSLLRGERRQEKGGRTIIEIPYLPGRKLPFFRKSVEDISFNLAALFWMIRHGSDYDLVHIQGRSGCFYSAFLPRWARRPTIATFHRLLNVEYRYDGQNTGLLDGWIHRHFMHWAEGLAAKRSDSIIAVSEEMRNELHLAFGHHLAPIQILPNGISMSFGEDQSPPVPWQLLYVGRLEKIKGLYGLIQALKNTDERITLTLVGEGPERKGLTQLVRKSGLSKRVYFLGDQDTELVSKHIRNSYALVLPSLHETQGIVLLEAGICKRPVIAAEAPGIVEVIENGYNGLLYPVGDVDSLSMVIDHLFFNPSLARRLGENGRRRCEERYNWDHIALRTAKLYDGLLLQKRLEGRHQPVISPDPLRILRPADTRHLAQHSRSKTSIAQ